MKSTILFILLAISLALCIVACKKDKKNTGYAEFAPPPSVLCDGNKSDSIYPLNPRNYWEYSVSDNGIYQFNNTDIQVLKDSFINGHQYMATADSSYRIYREMRFLRQGGSTKKIYFTIQIQQWNIWKYPANQQWDKPGNILI